MANLKEQSYKEERFEFALYVNGNIICKRNFKINDFIEHSMKSLEFKNKIDEIVNMIDNDLKSKSLVYLEIFAPRIFNTMEEFEKYIEKEENRNGLVRGEGVVIRNIKDHDFAWDGEAHLKALDFKFEDGEFSEPLQEENYVTYKFAFLDYGREVCSCTWVGVYPRFVRNSIDLSNKRGRLDPDELYRVGFEQYILYKLIEGRSDLVWKLVKDICYTCSESDDSWYTISSEYVDQESGKVRCYNNKTATKKLF